MKEWLKIGGFELSFLIIGAISGLIAMNSEEHRKKTRWERFIVGLSGFSCACFVTPVVVWGIELTSNVIVPPIVQCGIAFVIGQMGLGAVKMAFNLIVQFKKFRDEKTK